VFLKHIITQDGYSVVYFYDGHNKRKKHFVHRLIAQLFIGNPDNKKEVNHKDMNPSNNDISNLEWVTRNENVTHRKLMGGYEKQITQKQRDWCRVLGMEGRKMTSEQVEFIRSNYKRYHNAKELADMFNVSASTIRACYHKRSYFST
jgi:hypothetical protein